MGVLSSGEAGKSPINIAHRCNFLSYFPCPYLLIPFSTYSYFACCYICACVYVSVCVWVSLLLVPHLEAITSGLELGG